MHQMSITIPEIAVDASNLDLITVNTGEDIFSTLMAFSRQQQPGAIVYVLSANGSLQSGTLDPNGNFEGLHTIISLNGIFLLSETNMLTGSLGVSLCDSDGRVFGGEVSGALMAASPVSGRVFGGEVSGALMAASPVSIVVVIFHDDERSDASTPPSEKSNLGATSSPSVQVT